MIVAAALGGKLALGPAGCSRSWRMLSCRLPAIKVLVCGNSALLLPSRGLGGKSIRHSQGTRRAGQPGWARPPMPSVDRWESPTHGRTVGIGVSRPQVQKMRRTRRRSALMPRCPVLPAQTWPSDTICTLRLSHSVWPISLRYESSTHRFPGH